MKKQIIATICALLLSSVWGQAHEIQTTQAQYGSVKELVEAYSNREGVDYVDAPKAVIWMIKAKSPKGTMDGVKKLYLLNFDGATESYSSFRAEALELFEQLGIECVEEERSKETSMEIYMETPAEAAEYISEFMMFMLSEKGDQVFMLMQGELPIESDK